MNPSPGTPITQPLVCWERGGVNITSPNQALITVLFLAASKDPLPCNPVVPPPCCPTSTNI